MRTRIDDEFRDLIESAIRSELSLRRNQSPNDAAHAITREILRLMHERYLKVAIIHNPEWDEDGDGNDDN